VNESINFLLTQVYCSENSVEGRAPRETICARLQINKAGATNSVSSKGMEEHINNHQEGN